MAITIDNKTYRNLEEQVLKNKEDIARHYEVDRVIADWGIKVLGVVATVEDIPDSTYEYGDAFGLSSTNPMQYVIWTRANDNVGEATDYWLNIGALSLVGPQGPQGIQGQQGIQGVRGSKWVAASSAATGTNYNQDDKWLNTSNGDVYSYSATLRGWALIGNIRGPQGIQGPTGPKGEQGIQGPTGPQGPKGDTGSSFKIGGLLESVDNLPTPTEVNRSIGYAIRNLDGVTYDLYVVVGTDNLQRVNMGRVEGVQGPQGPEGPQGPAGVGATIIPISSSSKGGTLNPTKLQTIKTATYPIINLNNEYFVKADIYDSENEFVFSHVGNREGVLYNKTFTLNTASGDWTLKEVTVQELIDITGWIDNGVVPEEYRNEIFLRKSVLYDSNNAQALRYTFGTFAEEGSMVFSFINTQIYSQPQMKLNVSEYYVWIYDDWSVEFNLQYQENYIIKSAQIIEDQGKLELATYDKNNNIIDMNDSPNIYLQRRLDKPSVVFDLANSDDESILDQIVGKLNIGSVVSYNYQNKQLYGVVCKEVGSASETHYPRYAVVIQTCYVGKAGNEQYGDVYGELVLDTDDYGWTFIAAGQSTRINWNDITKFSIY